MKTIFSILLIIITLNFVHSQSIEDLTAAENAFATGDFRTAIAMYTLAIKSANTENSYMLFYKRGYCYFNLKNYLKSIPDLEIAQKVNKDNKDYIFIKGNSLWLQGNLYYNLNETAKSIKKLKQSLKCNEVSLLLSTIGYYEIKLKRYRESFNHLNRAIVVDSSNAYAYSNRALVNLKFSNISNAKTDIQKSIELNPENPYAYKHRAMIYIESKEYEPACKDLKKAEELKYAEYGSETDAKDVEELMKQYCK
jgi:tetratricopeptide (TPR) repeat protein